MRKVALNTSLIFSLILILFAISKHILMGSAAWDLGIFEQFCWLIANKSIHSISSLRGVSPLQDHFSLLLLPISFIYKLFPSTLTLLIIQSISLGSLPYLAVKDKKTNKLYIGLMIAIVLSPIIFLANLSNFHPEVLSAPFMLIAIQESIKDRRAPYYLSFLISLSAKKSQLLFGIGLSIYSFAKGKVKRALNSLIISISWWLIASSYSSISGDYIQERLGYLGDSKVQIIITLLTKPFRIFYEAPPEQIILYTLGLTLSFLILFGKESIPGLIGTIPVYFTNIISSAGSQRELYSQYSISILPFIIIACLDSIEGKKNLSERIINRIYLSTILISSIAFFGYSRIGYFQSRYLPNFKESIAFHKIKSNIPKYSAVLTNSQMGAHLANRELLHITEDHNFQELENYDYIILPKSKDKFIVKEAKKYKMDCYEPNDYHVICKKITN